MSRRKIMDTRGRRVGHTVRSLIMATAVFGASAFSACGGGDSNDDPPGGPGGQGGAGGEPSETPEVPDDAEFKQPSKPVDLHLRLNQVVYADGDDVAVELDLGDVDPDSDRLGVALVSEATGDVEVVELERDNGNVYVSKGDIELNVVSKNYDDVQLNDGTLDAGKDELFFALFAIDEDDDAFEDLDVGVAFDFGLASGSPIDVDARVDEDLALSDDEEDNEKPVATLLKEDGYPVQVATHELLAWPASDEELELLLDRTNGSEKHRMEDEDGNGRPIVSIEVDPRQAATESLDLLRALYDDDEGELLASRVEGLSIYALVLELQLDGFIVALNPKLQMQGEPMLAEPEASNLTHTMKMVRAQGVGSGDCVPGDDSRPCVENVPALWAFQDIFDKNETTVPVAVLDIGFAPNEDFREPTEGFVQCDMSASNSAGYRCGDGEAEGPPTVGNSFFGDKSWHGTGVVTTIGGIPYNDFGAAGVAGQVAEPMLYKYDFAAYAFEMGRGITLSTGDGASCINISGGYPCNMLTNVGPDFNICTVGGRAGICALVSAGAHAAAALTCATLGPIPFVGAAICATAIGGATAVTDACISTLAFGDLAGPIGRGVSYAKRRGVPVVTIAGNSLSRDGLPPVVRDLVDIDNNVTEDWGIVPAMHPDTIVVGAVGSDMSNVHFIGDRVDVWAPIRTAYMAPSSVTDPDSALQLQDIGGTSAAAPYITGVVASMQAANPELNPNSGEGDRSEMVDEIKRLLLADANTWSNGELADFGYADEPFRRKVVNPLAAVRAAARAYDVPDLEALGYDVSFNYSEIDATDDSAATATPLIEGTTATGTIYSIADEGETSAIDRDFYSVQAPAGGAQAYAATIELRTFADFGALQLVADNLTMTASGGASESLRRYTAILNPGGSSTFSVQGAAGVDNVYKLDVDFALAEYAAAIESPTATTPVCADQTITLTADATYQWDDSITVPNSSLQWYEGSTLLGSGATLEQTFTAGSHTITLVPFGDTDRATSVTFEAVDCTGNAPIVQIAVPSGDLVGGEGLIYDGYDDALELYYVDVQLVATSSDVEDGALPGSALSWSTDRSDIQAAALGTGQNITVRLYSNDCFGVTHTIQLVGQDSDGNFSAPVYVDIFIYTVC